MSARGATAGLEPLVLCGPGAHPVAGLALIAHVLAFVGVRDDVGDWGVFRHRVSDGALVALAYGPTREAAILAAWDL